MKNKTKYQSDIDSVFKALKLDDVEVLHSVLDQIYSEYDLNLADNIKMAAEYKHDQFILDRMFGGK